VHVSAGKTQCFVLFDGWIHAFASLFDAKQLQREGAVATSSEHLTSQSIASRAVGTLVRFFCSFFFNSVAIACLFYGSVEWRIVTVSAG
jgi:hypothetical protein